MIVGKSLNSLASCLLTGQTFRDSLQIGVGLAQIGDFAYLVALMGIRLTNGAEPYPAMYQVAVGVSIIYRPADQLGGNAAVGEARPDGVYVLGGDPSRIDAVAEAVAVVVETSPVGAILRESKIETLLLNPAVHYASLTLTFLQITTF